MGDAPAPPPLPHLPTVAALEALWDEVSNKPLWMGSRLWTYLSLLRRMRLRRLDPGRIRVVAPRHKVNDCRSCTDICCVGQRSAVSLRLRDIAALVDVGRTDLITTHKPRFSAAELETHPALRRHVSSRAWAVFPVLAQDSLGACRALTPSGRCGLYPHWPLACARFPYALLPESEQVFYSRRCDSFWIRPDAGEPVREMAAAAVAAYNARIQDEILLAYARDRLEALGLLRYLSLGAD